MTIGETPTAHTLAFALEFLPSSPATVLEIGAGTGELAAALCALDYQVIAIDSDQGAVMAIRGRGINAVHAAWPAYKGPPASAVIFSRSLHHLPVEPAVKQATRLLLAGGRIIVEDFAFAEMPAGALAWIRSWIDRLVAQSAWQTPSSGFLAGVSNAHSFRPSVTDDHDTADAKAMRHVLAMHGSLIYEAPAAYLYRYLITG